MTLTAGIPLLQLLGFLDPVESVLSASVEDFLDQFVAVDWSTSHSDAAIFHRGTLLPASAYTDAVPPAFDLGFGTLSIAGVNTGVPFQLALVRKAPAGNLEPAPDVWRLDLALDVFTLTVDGLEPALYVPESGTTPRHLVRDTTRDSVTIKGSATFRMEVKTAGAGVSFSFVEAPDPFDPAATSGAVATVTCSPPHFFIGGSEFGLSVGRLEFDFSETASPADVLARDQGPGWMGIAIAEATFYAPRNLPGLGDLSGGVKNVLLGRPMGLQGELEIQFGRSPMDPSAFQFEQVTDGGDVALSITGSGPSRTVTIQGSQGQDVTVRAGFIAPGPPTGDDAPPANALYDWSGDWTWPDGSADEGADSSSGSVRHGQVLRVTPIETITVDGDPTEFRHPEVVFRFVVAGSGPTIDATVGAEHFTNVVHAGGTADALTTVTFEAVKGGPDAGTFEWQVVGHPETYTGPQFQPQPADLANATMLVLREKVTPTGGEEETRLAHLALEVRPDGELLIGCEAGVFAATDDATALALAAVEDTFDLSDFHADGAYHTMLDQAEIEPSDNTKISVPGDGLARVTLAGPPPAPEPDRHVQVLMDFDTANELRWGDTRPAGATPAFSQTDLLAWAARYPGAQFLVVGRCDDIGDATYNRDLAKRRAARGVTLLTTLQAGQSGAAVAADRIAQRGEQDTFTGVPAGETLETDPSLGMSADERAEGRLIELEIPDSTGWEDARYVNGVLSEHEPVRDDYRRVDLYAVGGTPSADANRPSDAGVAPELRRSLVPAAGRDPAPVTPGSPSMDYRVKLHIAWDSPTVSDLRDAIPTLAEAEFAWTPQTMPLPELPDGGGDVALSRETLTVFVNWAHDARTGYTKASLGIRSEGDPDGLIASETKPLIAALAFGPALMSGLDPDSDLVGTGARIAALLGLVAFSTTTLSGADGPLVGDGSKVALLSAAFETEMRSISDPGADLQLRVVTDYVTTIHIDGGVLGIKTVPDQPMKIRYKRVGLQYDTSKEGWERFGLVYDSTSMEIEDAGRWEISGVLGKLLRIVEIAMGTGSFWIEGRIAIALDLGIIEITEAVIRLTFKDGSSLPDFELRGFVIKADISEVFEGEGRLRIEDDGTIRAGVDANIIPVGIGVEGALAFAKKGTELDPWIFLNIYLGVQFATPLPLANSGLAIYGFKGLFTMNGTRKLDGLAHTDPVLRELDWWNVAPENKYTDERGQFALGVGVVVGTMPDASFCVSCAGMLVVAFPDIEVILGVDVNIIQVPDTEAKDQRPQEASITGLIIVDSTAVKLAASAQYTIPGILEVKVPFAGYFPYSLTGVYVRIGSDGQHGRAGDPVTLKLLPGTLDATAWTYLMIEQDGLTDLGGDPRFSFEGFSVGWGAGWEIGWSAGPIKLEASAKVLVGFGTAPLMVKGGISVKGELDLVVVSVSAKGDLVLEAREIVQNDGSRDVAVKVDGEFCGEVDLFFFSLSGCVGVSIDNGVTLDPPVPPSPVRGIALTDRRDRIMGVATTAATPAAVAVFDPTDPAAGAAVSDNNTVWPDTAPVIDFAHYVENAMGAAAQFTPGPTPTQDAWFGSSELKYAYRLDSIELRAAGGAAVAGDKPLQSVWTSTPYRQPESSGTGGTSPSEHEGPSLKLLDWSPWAWVVNMANGGAGTPGDPVDTIDDLCDPPPVPRRRCLLGRRARRAGLNRVRIRAEHPPEPPYPSRFIVTGEPVLRLGTTEVRGRPLVELALLAGSSVVPGAVVPLPFAATVAGHAVTEGYRFPAVQRALIDPPGLETYAVPWEGTFSEPVTDPSVLLLICDAPGQATPTDDTKTCDDLGDLKPDGELPAIRRPGMTIEPLAPGDVLRLVDDVDETVSPAVPGQDGAGEIRIPERGIGIRFMAPVRRVELSVMQFGMPLRADALAADGSVLATATTPAVQHVEHQIVLAAPGIAGVRVRGGSGEADLLRVCVTAGPAERTCMDFDGAKLPDKRVSAFLHRGLRFASRDGSPSLGLVDRVDVRPEPDAPGSDGRPELAFAAVGLRVELPVPCDRVELHLMLFEGDPVKAIAFDATGARAWRGGTDATRGVPQVVTAEARGMVAVELAGGANAAVLYEVCYTPSAQPGTPGTPGTPGFPGRRGTVAPGALDGFPGGFAGGASDALRGGFAGRTAVRGGTRTAAAQAAPERLFGRAGSGASGAGGAAAFTGGPAGFATHPGQGSSAGGTLSTGAADTTVTGMVGDTPVDAWPGTVIERREGKDGRACELVRFVPADPKAGPWDGFRVEPPAGKTVTLVAVCGIDQRAADHRAQDAAVSAQLATILTTAVLAEPDMRREIVLLPDTTYEIAVGWSWQAWQPDDPGQSPPPTPDGSAWAAGPTDVLRFHTAADTSLAAGPDDGLNEHTFDARDVGRYVVAVEPADGRVMQLTDDPIWVHLDAGHVQQLLDLYGRDLAIEVRRTDPPPQPNGDLTAVLLPLEVTLAFYDQSADTQPEGYRQINEALLDPAVAPCVPSGAPMGGTSIAVTADLAPDADYDLNVVAPRRATAPGGEDRPVVLATRFRTSHYATPRELVDALGYTSPDVLPFLPDELLIPDGMAFPAGGFVEGDLALDDALAAIDADTLPLPRPGAARSYVCWSFDAVAGWRVEGLVVDSPEPLRREMTVVDANGVAGTGVRMEPLRATIGGAVLDLYRANARWTRVLLRPAAPISVPTPEATLAFELTTSDGTVGGSRRLRAVPSVLEREGL